MDRKSEKRPGNIQKRQSLKKNHTQKEKKTVEKECKSGKEEVLYVELDKELKQSLHSL